MEVLISLAIVALLLTATAAATDACFKAYADATRQFSVQAATRMVTNRILLLIRTGTAHGPLNADASSNPPATLNAGTNTVTSPYIEMIDASNRLVRFEYRAASQELWMITSNVNGSNVQQQSLLGGVTQATFSCVRRRDANNLWVLARATLDFTVQPDADNTLTASGLTVEQSANTAIHVVASTMPRKVQ